MTDIDKEIERLFLALELSEEATRLFKSGADSFDMFRSFARIIRIYDKRRIHKNK